MGIKNFSYLQMDIIRTFKNGELYQRNTVKPVLNGTWA